MTRKMLDYQEELIKALNDPEEALEYLNAALEDNDPRVFMLALKNVIDAQGETTMTALAKKADLNRENLYKMLSKKGNPQLTSLSALLKAVGFQLTLQPMRK